MNRRGFLAFLLAVGSSASCTARETAEPATPRPGPPTSPSDTPLPSPGEASPPVAAEDQPSGRLPGTLAWQPGPGEPQPDIKVAAARFLERAGSWTDYRGPATPTPAPNTGLQTDITLDPLRHDQAAESVVQVIYPQYGGLEADDAAVMVLLDQHLLRNNDTTSSRQLALDVRLRRTPAGTWAVVQVRPLTSLGSPTALSAPAAAVLDHPRVELSAPARLDVESGRMDDRLLTVLAGLADRWTLSVQVMHTGHIQTVFPTDRRSNHAVGRAVDIRSVDGHPVADPDTPRALLTELMTAAGQLGATEVGGPFDLNGEPPGFFTDQVHQDHLHLGVSEGKPPALLTT